MVARRSVGSDTFEPEVIQSLSIALVVMLHKADCGTELVLLVAKQILKRGTERSFASTATTRPSDVTAT